MGQSKMEEIRQAIDENNRAAERRCDGGCGGCPGEGHEPPVEFTYDPEELHAHEIAMAEATRVRSWAEAFVAMGEMLRAEMDERRQFQLELAARVGENAKVLVDYLVQTLVATGVLTLPRLGDDP